MATFTARDLALALPDKAGDIISLRHTGGDAEQTEKFEALKPKLDPSKKVTRYFPGQAPKWLQNENQATSLPSSSGAPSARAEDRRLARLAATAKVTSESSAPRRRIYDAEVVQESEESGSEDDKNVEILNTNDDEEDEDEIIARRNRIRQRLQAHAESTDASVTYIRLPVEDPVIVNNKFNLEGKSSDDEEYETESEYESSEEEQVIMRPVFVPKHKRETIKEKEAELEAELLKEKQVEEKLEKRKQQTKVLLAESLQRKDEERMLALEGTDNDSDAGMPDDTDDLDDDVEFENWRLREITRLKRDTLIREQIALEKADLERRRGLSEEERRKEDEEAGKFKPKEKEKWKFMQKYYHKGVFYMDEDSTKDDDVRKRDFSQPTLEDKYDRSSLPKVLQVKKFGFRGRTKYTHLLDQDTTRVSNPLKHDEKLLKAYVEKRAGVHGDLDSAGRTSKKSKY